MSIRGVPARKRGRPCKASTLARGALTSGRGASTLARGAKRPYIRRVQNQESIDIGNELIRWTVLKEGNRMSSDEDVAKQLLDFWDTSRKLKRENSLSLGPATIRDFENFQLKTKRSADELIRYFLRLDLEPGQNVIVVSDGASRVFDALKSKLKFKSNDLLTNLLEVHAKHTKWCGVERQKPELEIMRRAIREEMVTLVQEGVLPRGSHFPGQIVGARQESDRHVYDGHDETMSNERPENRADGMNKDLTPESAKKRSRKSLPQRVILEREHVIDSDIEEICVESELDPRDSRTIGVESAMNPSDSRTKETDDVLTIPDDTELMQYNYIINPNTVLVPSGSPPADNVETSMASGQSSESYTSTFVKDDSSEVIYRLGQHTITRDINGQLHCPYCDYKSSVIARIRRHVSIHTGKGFKCSMCDRSYTDEYKLKQHFKVKHEQSIRFKCDLCTREFTSKGGLRYHRRTLHHKDFNYWCQHCSKGFNQMSFYKAHMSKHGRPSWCYNCKKEFSSAEALLEHSKSCGQEGNDDAEYECETCSVRFKSSADLESHVAAVHGGVPRFRCGCGRDFRWRAKFDNHRATCSLSGIPSSSSLNELKTEDGLLNIAIVNVQSMAQGGAEEKSTNVNFDDNSVQITNMESGEQFIYDLTEDDDAKPKLDEGLQLSCKHCTYKTDKKTLLKRHEMTHGKRKYKCNECNQSFSELNRLRTHQNAKHKGKCGYKCDKCSRTFLSKGGIMYHQQTKHNNSYKYRCETCDKGFNTIQHYLGHKNTHTGVRPFVCDKCNVGFAYPSVLSSHKRVCKGKVDGVNMNGGLDLFPCKECKEKFAMFPALQQHVHDMHGTPGRNRYLCECGADFELHALYEHHKSSCNQTSRSIDMMMLDMAGEGVDDERATNEDVVVDDEFKQLSPDKFNAIISTQPVFPL